MSIPYTPLQSFGGSGPPPECSPNVRRIVGRTHSSPPANGVPARPETECRNSPGFWLRTFDAWTTNPLLADALDVPLQPIAGVQPSELTFAVQSATGAGRASPLLRSRSACVEPSSRSSQPSR